MAMVSRTPPELDYPTSDGRPVAETDLHRQLMFALIAALKAYYAKNPQVYVSGNLLVFYVPGNRRRHVSPDVFVVFGVPNHLRLNYLVWQEGKGPEVVIELTSSSTRTEDIEEKFVLYRDTLKVREYLLFDPQVDFLHPPLQGYRLVDGEYVRIELVAGRLPSEVLGLHLEQVGSEVRLYDPETKTLLPTPEEETAARRQAETERDRAKAIGQQAEAERDRADFIRRQAETERDQANYARGQAEAEIERLRQELEALRRSSGADPTA
jgi:Uma2 family endonuclease